MGSVYRRGQTWWIQYYHHGTLLRESSKSALKTAAATLLKKREGDLVDGRLPALQAEKTTFEDLTQQYQQDLAINRPKALIRVRSLVAHLQEGFAGLPVIAMTTSRMHDYVLARRAQQASNATINRELGALKRMFRLAAQQTPPLVKTVPHIPILRVDNVRTGFFTEEEYQVLRAALPDHLKVPFILGYWIGMRAGEILSLRWEQIDWTRGLLRLEPGTTKNGKGRVVPLVEEVLNVLTRWRNHTHRQSPGCPWVCHYEGRSLGRIQKHTWDAVCRRVGLQGKLFHDLRRTAIRNMVRAGISERVAMQISGHKTRSVFDRYDIVSEGDLLEARRRLQATQPDPIEVGEGWSAVERSSGDHNVEHKDRGWLDGPSLSM